MIFNGNKVSNESPNRLMENGSPIPGGLNKNKSPHIKSVGAQSISSANSSGKFSLKQVLSG